MVEGRPKMIWEESITEGCSTVLSWTNLSALTKWSLEKGCHRNYGEWGEKHILGARATGRATVLEIVIWSRPEQRTTWSASPSHRRRPTWPRIGETNVAVTSTTSKEPTGQNEFGRNVIRHDFHQVWSLLFPWYGRSLPPIRLYSWPGFLSCSMTTAENICCQIHEKIRALTTRF